MKYVVITGGVISGLGKGITASSLGLLLKQSGLTVSAIKIDPYINIDAGTMSPYEHGEVYVLNDGGEVDLDLGNYERFLNINLTKRHNITTGKIYKQVIEAERKGNYLGKTVQMVPHITDAIIDHIINTSKIAVDNNGTPDLCIIELGGTVGDIESMIFLEAIRQLSYKIGKENFCLLHVSLVPTTSEQKTKPTQHSIIKLRSLGLIPDFIVCRSKDPISDHIKEKIARFCMININNVIGVHNVDNLYKVPQLFQDQNMCAKILKQLNIKNNSTDISLFNRLAQEYNIGKKINIVIVGKYVGLTDSYLSLEKALKIAGIYNKVNVNIIWFDAEKMDISKISNIGGILVPGGFGQRGFDGKIKSIKFARENKIPFFGICLGMQLSVIEYARNVCNLTDVNSEEFSKNKNDIIKFMPEIGENMGGTMRLGSKLCKIKPFTLAHKIYKNTQIYERHRHRYEVNPTFIKTIEKSGLIFSGSDELNERMEIVELPHTSHPFFIACQFHPEYTSRPNKPNPLFDHFIRVVSESP